MQVLSSNRHLGVAINHKGVVFAISVYIYEFIFQSTHNEKHRHPYLNTKGANNFNLPYQNSTLYSRKSTYDGAKLCNVLFTEVKRKPPDFLKRRLDCWLLRDPVLDRGVLLQTDHHDNRFACVISVVISRRERRNRWFSSTI
ncbi:hypothetical protein J6590_066365 [Homalodisca vitripennis]|nr:hypothetical protein J6590_066365 [Homalodisca vitripennis]